jgi:hypothetical protein
MKHDLTPEQYSVLTEAAQNHVAEYIEYNYNGIPSTTLRQLMYDLWGDFLFFFDAGEIDLTESDLRYWEHVITEMFRVAFVNAGGQIETHDIDFELRVENEYERQQFEQKLARIELTKDEA